MDPRKTKPNVVPEDTLTASSEIAKTLAVSNRELASDLANKQEEIAAKLVITNQEIAATLVGHNEQIAARLHETNTQRFRVLKTWIYSLSFMNALLAVVLICFTIAMIKFAVILTVNH